MIVVYYDNIVITGKTLTVISEKIVTATAGEPASVHVNHDRTAMRTVNFRRPNIHAKTILTRNSGSSPSMQQEGIFISVCKVLSIRNKVRGVLSRTDASVVECITNAAPRFRLSCRHESPDTTGGGTIRHAFESVYVTSLESTDFSRCGFHHRCCVGRDNYAPFTTPRRRLRRPL